MENTYRDEYILAYDLGSTGLKSAIFDVFGEVVASKYETYETYYLRPTWIEQNPEEWWSALCNTTITLLKETNISPERIKAIVPVGHQIGAVPVNQEGNLLRKRAPLWCDARNSKQARELIKKIGGYPNFYRIHGLGHPPEILSICKAMWLKENEPDNYAQTYKFLQSKDFIILYLTDKSVFVDDYGDASNTGWLDIKKREYSDELLEAAGLSRDKLPDLRESHEVVGYLGKDAAKQTGLKVETPIVLGSGDVPAGFVGGGIIEERMNYCSIGSANWTGSYANEPCLDPDIRMINGCHPWKGYTSFSYTAAGGVSQDWFEDTICDVDKKVAEQIDIASYDVTQIKAMRAPVGSAGLFYFPYLRGGGGPHWNPNSKGAFVGLTFLHKKEHLARAVLEGVALNFRWLMDQTERAGIPIIKENGIRAIGGGAKNRAWLQIYADVLGMKVLPLKSPHEVTSRGGFISAAVALNWYRDYPDAVEKVVKIDKIIEADMDNNKIYNDSYPIFKSIYESLAPMFDNIATFQEKYSTTQVE